MDYIYKAKFVVSLRDFSPEVGKLEDRVNETLKNVGVHDRMQVMADLLTATVISKHELTDVEQHKIKVVLESQVIKTFPKYDIRLKSFGLESVSSEGTN